MNQGGEVADRGGLLRVAYVWRDEVMADLVALGPRKVTLGSRRRCTFVTPDLGLPPRFTIIRPGARGYVLTLGTGMAGRLRLGGEEMEVADFVRRGGGERGWAAKGSFRAASVGPGDWGVIHLDGRGEHNLFFQFVASDPLLPRRGARDMGLLGPALFFALLVHASFVIYALLNPPTHSPFVFPGKREVMAEYLLVRPTPPPEPDKAGRDEGEKKKEEKAAATEGKEGKSGGEGDKPRAKVPDPDKGDPNEMPGSLDVGLVSSRSRTEIAKALNRGGFEEKLAESLGRLKGDRVEGGLGSGSVKGFTGYGTGPGGTGTSTRGGTGTGGGGKSHGDLVSNGPLDTGGVRAGGGAGGHGGKGGGGVAETQVKVALDQPGGELGGLTAEEILRVVKSRQNAIRSCYERELQRNRNLGGKVVVTWRIDSSGAVQAAKVLTSTLQSGSAQDCIVRQIQALHFPSPRGDQIPKVKFPFLFEVR